MFTGIIQNTALILEVKKDSGLRVFITKPKIWKLKKGQSVSVNGICSTVQGFTDKNFEVFYMPETLNRTTAALWQKNCVVNLEKSLTLKDELGGHIVQGHIDTVGVVKDVKIDSKSYDLKIFIAKKYMCFVAEKGSIAIDGVSLTVAKVGPNWLLVSLIRYTLAHTNFNKKKKGDKVNIEFDIIAKYIKNLIKNK